eukprot:7361263-Pyramimonas_sp.AAC.1
MNPLAPEGRGDVMGRGGAPPDPNTGDRAGAGGAEDDWFEDRSVKEFPQRIVDSVQTDSENIH